MPQSFPPALLAHIQGELTTIATCWLVTRTDGAVFGFTEHESDLAVSGVTYKASTGFSRSAISSASDLSVPNIDAVGLLSSPDISEADLRAGHFD